MFHLLWSRTNDFIGSLDCFRPRNATIAFRVACEQVRVSGVKWSEAGESAVVRREQSRDLREVNRGEPGNAQRRGEHSGWARVCERGMSPGMVTVVSSLCV